METFGKQMSAEACSGKEIAGLLKKMMMMMTEMAKKIFSGGQKNNHGTLKGPLGCKNYDSTSPLPQPICTST